MSVLDINNMLHQGNAVVCYVAVVLKEHFSTLIPDAKLISACCLHTSHCWESMANVSPKKAATSPECHALCSAMLYRCADWWLSF